MDNNDINKKYGQKYGFDSVNNPPVAAPTPQNPYESYNAYHYNPQNHTENPGYQYSEIYSNYNLTNSIGMYSTNRQMPFQQNYGYANAPYMKASRIHPIAPISAFTPINSINALNYSIQSLNSRQPPIRSNNRNINDNYHINWQYEQQIPHMQPIPLKKIKKESINCGIRNSKKRQKISQAIQRNRIAANHSSEEIIVIDSDQEYEKIIDINSKKLLAIDTIVEQSRDKNNIHSESILDAAEALLKLSS